MNNDSSPDLSGWQLAKHVAGGLPIGLLLGFLTGSLVYVLLMYPIHHGGLSESMAETADTLFRINAAFVGIFVTGLWIYYAEDTSTGIRLSEVFGGETNE